MKKDAFKIARGIREQIAVLEAKQSKISRMEPTTDEEVIWLRQTAYDGIDFAIKTLESDFEKL